MLLGFIIGKSNPLAKTAIATSYRYKTTTGEQKEEVCFLDLNFFGRSAEIANQYLKKGSKILMLSLVPTLLLSGALSLTSCGGKRNNYAYDIDFSADIRGTTIEFWAGFGHDINVVIEDLLDNYEKYTDGIMNREDNLLWERPRKIKKPNAEVALQLFLQYV